MTGEQRAQIPLLLAPGAESYGFRGELWTSKRVAMVIKRTFGVTYHPDHVRKRLRVAGGSPQPPKTQASQRNDEAIAEWVEERWPLITKKRTRNTAPSSS